MFTQLDNIDTSQHWTLIGQGTYNRVYSSNTIETYGEYTGRWVVKFPLSSGGLLITSIDPSIHDNRIKIRSYIRSKGLSVALLRFEHHLYVINTKLLQLDAIDITKEQLKQCDQALQIVLRKKNTVHRLIMTEIALISPFIPNHLTLFDEERLSTCSRGVRKWNRMNPLLPAYEINPFCWITPYVGKTPATDNQIKEMLINLYCTTGILPLDACGINNVLVHNQQAICVDADCAIERNSVISEDCLANSTSAWNDYWDTYSEQREPKRSKTVAIIRTLLYLDQIPTNMIKPDFFSPVMLPLLHFFRNKQYDITAEKLNLLHMLCQYEDFELTDYKTRRTLSKIATGYYTTPIMYYVSNQDTSFLRTLLQQRTDLLQNHIINAVNCDGYTALMLAVEDQRLDMVEFLVTLNPILTPRDKKQGWNVIQFAYNDYTHPNGPRILKSLLRLIVNEPACSQAAMLVNLFDISYANVFQFTLLNDPKLFTQLSHVSEHSSAWTNVVETLLTLKDRLDNLKFDDYLNYFELKGKTDHHNPSTFSGVIRTLYLTLKQAKIQLILSNEPIHMSLATFRQECNVALQQSDAYFARNLFPTRAYSVLFFVFPPDDFKAKYQAFKEMMCPDSDYVFVNA